MQLPVLRTLYSTATVTFRRNFLLHVVSSVTAQNFRVPTIVVVFACLVTNVACRSFWPLTPPSPLCKSALCPRVLWFSEWTMIITDRNSTGCSVLVTETYHAFCAVRIEFYILFGWRSSFMRGSYLGSEHCSLANLVLISILRIWINIRQFQQL